jgi:hypothetical protein
MTMIGKVRKTNQTAATRDFVTAWAKLSLPAVRKNLKNPWFMVFVALLTV